MRQLIPYRLALYAMLYMMALVLLFHILVIIEVIPYSIVWGGRLESKQAFYKFELVSIVINLLMLLIFLFKSGKLKSPINDTFLRILIGLQALLFLLNMLGNLVAVSIWERVIFAPLTFLAFIFCTRIMLEKKGTPNL